MTDFTVFRPKCLNNTEVLKKKHWNAETLATRIFETVILDGKDQWIYKQNAGGQCRMNFEGKFSEDIEHRHKPCKII